MDSKPTASDPTVQLSVHVSEEQKLIDWFHDGHRAARQQEFAKSLISTAVSANYVHNLRITGGVMTAEMRGQFENTYPFVRLYEGLSEYAEDSRNGNGRSYFTRSWKAAPSPMREPGLVGNSHFSGPAAHTGRGKGVLR